MKKIIITLFSFVALISVKSYSQSKDNANYISLSTYIDSSVEEKADGAASVLSSKLNQIVSSNGMSSSYSRFIITANINPLTKDVLGTAPTTIAYTLDVTFYIGDGVDGNKFASYSKTVKGVGSNETKAFINAFKSINTSDKELQNFITKGKSKIIEYYNSRCDLIIKQARVLQNQNQFDEALYMLTSIPDACTDCYNKAIPVIEEVYKAKINSDCKTKLQEAKLYWASNPTLDGANVVADILSDIDPRASCYNEVNTFSKSVGKRVLELDGREWKFKVDTELGLEKDRIKAIRDIGVAWGNGQPNTVNYNVHGWW